MLCPDPIRLSVEIRSKACGLSTDFSIFLIIISLSYLGLPSQIPAGEIDDSLEAHLRTLSDDELVSVIVSLKDQVDMKDLDLQLKREKATRREWHEQVIRRLRDKASRTQPVLELLATGRSAAADPATGDYVFILPGDSTYTVRVTHYGHDPVEQSVYVVPDDTTSLDLSMDLSPTGLLAFPMERDFYDDMEGGLNGWTHSIVTPGYFDQWRQSDYRNHTGDGSISWKCGGPGPDKGTQSEPSSVSGCELGCQREESV